MEKLVMKRMATAIVAVMFLSGCGVSSQSTSTAPSPSHKTNPGTSVPFNSSAVTLASHVVITSFQFVNRQQGWAVGYQRSHTGQIAALWKTSDAGSTWRSTHLAGISPEYIHMENAKRGWIVGLSNVHSSKDAALFETLNGGRSWNFERTFKLPSGLSTEEIRNSLSNVTMSFLTDRSGWLAIQGRMYQTTDGGNIWRPASQPGVILHVSSISHSVFAIGFSRIWEWDNRHRTWVSRYTLPPKLQKAFYGTQNLRTWFGYLPRNQITFSSSRTGYALFSQPNGSMQGQDYLLIHSQTGGHSWRIIGGSFVDSPKDRGNTRELPAGYISGMDAVPGGEVFVGMSFPFPYPMLGMMSSNHAWSWVCDGLHAPAGWRKGTLYAMQWLASNTGWVVVQDPAGEDMMLRTRGKRDSWVDITPQ